MYSKSVPGKISLSEESEEVSLSRLKTVIAEALTPMTVMIMVTVSVPNIYKSFYPFFWK